jgi:hypothetical protein
VSHTPRVALLDTRPQITSVSAKRISSVRTALRIRSRDAVGHVGHDSTGTSVAVSSYKLFNPDSIPDLASTASSLGVQIQP